MEKFYVYVYLDPREIGFFNIQGRELTFRPIYIGKGCDSRMISHLSLTNRKIKSNKKLSDFQEVLYSIIKENKEPIIIKIVESLSSIEALRLEEILIDEIKLVSDGGLLFNKVKKGTHGNSGRIFNADWREKLSKSKLGDKNPMKDKTNSNKVSISKTGVKRSNVTINKIRLSMKGDKNHNFGKFKIIEQYDKKNNLLRVWIEGLDYIEKDTKINKSNIIQVCKNKRETAGGFIWKYKN